MLFHLHEEGDAGGSKEEAKNQGQDVPWWGGQKRTASGNEGRGPPCPLLPQSLSPQKRLGQAQEGPQASHKLGERDAGFLIISALKTLGV